MVVKKRDPIPAKGAIQRIVNQQSSMPAITVALGKSLDHTLAEDTVATYDTPRFDKSSYDGFAVHSVGSQGTSGQSRIGLKVIDHIGAGSVSGKLVGDHGTVCIITGVQIPNDADAVVMFERTIELEDTFTIRRPFSKNENMSLRGEEAKADDVALKEGRVINPGAIAVLAAYGYAEVKVIKQPSVAVVATGSESLGVNDVLEDGKIRNSSGPMIRALAEKLGLEVDICKTQKNDLDSGIQVVKEAMEKHDIIITTDGISVGDLNYLPEIYKAVKAEVLSSRVAMRPGNITTVAFVDGKYLFGLSGNPLACFTGFGLFVRPAVKHIRGALEIFPQIIKATLVEDLTKANPFTRFIRAKATLASSRVIVAPSGFSKSDAVVTIAHTNCMVMLPGGLRGFKAGHTVDIILTESDAAEEELLL